MTSILNAACEPGEGKSRPHDAPKSIVAQLLHLRRSARTLQVVCNSFHARMNSARRALQLTELTGDTALRLSRQADVDILRLQSRACTEQARSIGRMLMDLAPRFDAATSADDRFSILNINVADRHAIEPEDMGFVTLVLAHGLEDSAFYRGTEIINSPLHNCLSAEMIRVMTQTDAGRKATADAIEENRAAGGIFARLDAIFAEKERIALGGGPLTDINGVQL